MLKERGRVKQPECDLAMSYEERAFLNLSQLKDELLDEDMKLGDADRWDRHRIFRDNNFEDIDIRTKKRTENLLKYTLKYLGHYIDKNISEIAKENGSVFDTPTTLRDYSQHSSRSSGFLGPEVRQGNCLLLVDRKNKDNFTYDKRGVIHLRSRNHIKFTANKTRQPLMLTIIAKALRLIGTNNYMSQRELYYKCLDFCRVKKPNSIRISQAQNATNQPSQQVAASQQNKEDYRYSTANLEHALNDICCLVGCSKVHLHILPQAKGLVYGNLKLKLKNGELIDCLSKSQGTVLPMSNVAITHIETDAKFVLVLEKDSVMQKIIDQEHKSKFLSQFKAIIVTGKGYPDWNTKTFVNFLWKKLNVPILALTDADPHGAEIVCAYKFGSYVTAYNGSTLVTPQIRWLGLLPSDVVKLSIDDNRTLPHTSGDLAKLNSLLARPYIRTRPDWAEQLMLMRTMSRKAEIECLEDEFLVSTYLPNKLKYASWL